MKTLSYVLLLVMASVCFSCQTMVDDEIASSDKKELKVKARSASDAPLEYPLYLYAFNEEGVCSASQTIENEDEEISLSLSVGSYRVVAISGISDDYEIPKKPSIDDVISMEETSGASTALMMGKADVKISADNNSSLKLTLSYVVTSITVSLTNIPEEVVAVNLILSPFYSSLSLDGVYGDGGQKLEIPCMLSSDGTWNADEIYSFPGSGKETVFSIVMKYEDGSSQTHGYTYEGTAEANHPFCVEGNYAGGVIVSGTFITQGWSTPTEVSFNFGSGASSEDDDFENTDVDLSSAPKVGTIWNGAIVAEIKEVKGSEVSLLLMGVEEENMYSSGVADFLEENGTDGWWLPDAEEAKMLNKNFQGTDLEALNAVLSAKGYTEINVTKRYFYDNDGEIYAFGFKSTSRFIEAGKSTKYRLRLVKTMTYTLEE